MKIRIPYEKFSKAEHYYQWCGPFEGWEVEIPILRYKSENGKAVFTFESHDAATDAQQQLEELAKHPVSTNIRYQMPSTMAGAFTYPPLPGTEEICELHVQLDGDYPLVIVP